MEKKYQVFVSSTYEDLQEERKKVMEALLQMNCFPVGMEYFNASDSSQWEVIKSLIRECDYYVLIVAGRYGSIEEESGKSYTQKEFEYAIEQGVPVISFVHKNPGILPGIKIESNPKCKEKLESFKSEVKKKLCKLWDNADGLASQVVLSLNSLIKTNPRVGWVKANEVSSADANKEILALRKENAELIKQIEEIKVTPPVGSEMLKQGEDSVCLHFISSHEATEFGINQALRELCFRDYRFNYKSFVELLSEDFYTILIQFSSLGLIAKSEKKRGIKDTNVYWTLTPYGYNEMIKLKAVKK